MRVQASSSVNLGDRKAGEAEEVAQSWFGACTSHRTGDLGLQFPGPAPRRMPHVFSRSPAHLPLPETREGGEEHVPPTRGTEHTAKPPPGIPARPSAWLRRREAGVCHVPGTADQLDCCVLFCEAFPAPLCVTWYLPPHHICPLWGKFTASSHSRVRVCLTFISVPLSPAQGLEQEAAGAQSWPLSEMKAEEERRREKEEERKGREERTEKGRPSLRPRNSGRKI